MKTVGLLSFEGGVRYQGTWNATTNSPDLGASTPEKGFYYVVGTAGATSLGGFTDWGAKDWAIYNGSAWEKVDNTDQVTSVFARQGVVTAQVGDYSSFYLGISAQAADSALLGGAAAALYARLASPTFTGTPLGPTAAVDTATTQLASTAYVVAQAAAATPLVDGVAAVGTSTRFARGDHVHPTDTTLAPKASPALTGTPTAPTAAVDTNTTQLATTAYVIAQASAVGDGTPAIDGTAARGTSTHFARADHVHPTDTTRAALASPALTGTPTAPTPAASDNSTKIATTAYVDTADALKANLASPALTGTPTAPTAAVDTNTTQLATTAMVLAQAAAATPAAVGTAAVGTSTRFARADHVHAPEAHTENDNQTGPTIDGATTATAAGTIGRMVYGDFTIAPTATQAAAITCQVESAVASGTYVTVSLIGAGAGLADTYNMCFCFFVATGRRYRFSKTSNAGTTEAFHRYNYVEW